MCGKRAVGEVSESQWGDAQDCGGALGAIKVPKEPDLLKML